jgi:ABC-type transport system involved in cytochrome bd biosynthesis fused ATPase/permease subunit
MPSARLNTLVRKRLKRWALVTALGREAGWRHVASLALLAATGTALDLTGLGLVVAILFGGAGSLSITNLPLAFRLSAGQAVLALVLLMVLRGGLQAAVAVAQEQLRSGFTDRLRHQLLHRVLLAPTGHLGQMGRGELLGLLMTDISRTVLALDQGIRCLQALLAALLYATGVLMVGRQAAVPLLAGLVATALAALLQRSGSWELGQVQSRLHGALQRTLGDGLHGLKAVRTAGAEPWVLERFARETAMVRRVLREGVRRQAFFGALRDGLVVGVVGLWLLWGRADLVPSAMATTLLLAYRASGSASAVIQAQRLCLGCLPGYAALRELRERLGEPRALLGAAGWRLEEPLLAVAWEGGKEPLAVRRGELVVVAGPSGSGKTTLLDRFCGQLGEEQSHWSLTVAGGPPLQLSGPTGVRHWRSLVAYAPQKAVLFECSLRENLLLQRSGDGAVSNGLLEGWLEELDLAHLLERPGGLEAGLNLSMECFSGGEIHRLGLLRAWLLDRPIEVLDEPTAFLDASAAERVRQIIRRRSRERLVVVSSHDAELVTQAGHVVRPGGMGVGVP